MTAEDELRERLRVLAEAAGVAVPPLEITDDARSRLLPAHIRRRDDGETHIVVTEALLHVGASERTWRLAACLGYWTSPVPRRRRRQGWAVLGLVFVPYSVLGLWNLSADDHLPGWVVFAIGTTLLALGDLVLPAMSRRFHRALDESGRDVLRRAGYEPAALTREVFGAQADPSWWQRLHGMEPMPRERVRAAGGSAPAVHPPLY